MPENIVIEHRRSWRKFFLGIAPADEHDNSTDVNLPTGSSAAEQRRAEFRRVLKGVLKWFLGFFYRGYVVHNDSYLCPWAYAEAPGPWAGRWQRFLAWLTNLDQEGVRAHEAAHTPLIGLTLPLLGAPRDEDGSLLHEELARLDIMLPAVWSWFRWRDTRGVREAYQKALKDGRIVVVMEV